MATNPLDPSKNIEAAEKMKEALQSAENSADNIKASFDQQLKVVMQLRNTMAEVCNIMNSCGKEAVQQGSILSEDTWNKVEKKINDATSTQRKYNETAEKTAKILKTSFSTAAQVAMGAIKGLGQGIRNLYAITSSVTGILGGAIGVLYRFGKALVMAPFRIIESLFDMSKGATDTALATAIEGVRAQFGSLKSESSDTVLSVAKGMGKLDDTGVSAWRLFGNLAERVEAVKKLAMGMGASFQVFQGEIMANGEAIMRYNKGLGITEEMMSGISSTALRMGSSISAIQLDMTKQALGMSKAFGVNAKVISRDMAVAMKDLAHFGHLSTKEIAVAATFANKLGVSVDKLTSILDATKTFDQTAESVSKLNEQFNTNINAQELMMAESPAEQLEILRNEFSRAGVDVSKLNRFQRDLIKNTGLMSDELMNSALSSRNAGVSYHEMARQGKDNEAQVMTQRQAMVKLADSMERLVKAAEFVGGGILKHIIEGFGRGVQQSGPFMKMMLNMNQVLQESMQFGVKLGHMFVNLFPGVKDIFGGIADMFDPARYKKMFNKVLDAFGVFGEKGSGRFEDFMDRLNKAFFEFFDEGKPAGKRVLEGLKKFGEAVLKIFGKMSEWVIKELANVVVGVTEWLKNPKMPNLEGPSSGFIGTLLNPLQGSIKALTEKLWPALKDLGEQLLKMLEKAIAQISPKTKMIIMSVLGGIIFGPAILGAIGGLASAGIFKAAGSLLSGNLLKMVGSAAETVASTGAKAAGAGGTSAAAAVSKTAAAAIPEAGDAKKLESVSSMKIDFRPVLKFLVGFAGVVAVGFVAFFGAMYIIKKNKVTLEDVAMTAAVFAVISGVMLSAAAFSVVAVGIGKLLSGNQEDAIIKGLVSMSAVLLTMLLATRALIHITKDVRNPDTVKAGAMLLEAVASAFIKAGAAILLAIPVGIAVGNAFGGAAALGGFSAMTAAVAAMSKLAVDIMKSFAEIKARPEEVLTNTKAFTLIMDSIFKMVDGVRMLFETLDLRNLDAAGKEKIIKSATEFVKTLLEGQHGDGGIKGLVDSLIYGMKTLPADSIAKANAFGVLLGSIAEMMKATVSGLNVMSKDTLTQINIFNANNPDPRKNAEAFGSKVKGIQGYVEVVLEQSSKFIDGIIKSVQNISDVEKLVKVGPALGGILKSMGEFLQVLMPDVEKFKVATRTQTSSSSGALGLSASSNSAVDSAKVDAAGLTGMMTYMKTLIETVSGVMPGFISAILTGVGTGIKQFDKKSLDALPAIASVLSSVSSVVTMLAREGSITVIKQGNLASAEEITNSIQRSLPKLGDRLKQIGEALPDFMGNIKKMADALPADTKGYKERVMVIKDVFDVVAGIMHSISDSGKAFKSGEGAADVNQQVNVMLKNMNAVKNVLQGLALGNWESLSQTELAQKKTGDLTFKNIVDNLNMLATSAAGAGNMGEKIKVVSEIFSGVSAIVKSIAGVSLGEGNVDERTKGILSTFNGVSKTLNDISFGADAPMLKIATAIENIESNIFTTEKIFAMEQVAPQMKEFGKSISQINAVIKDITPPGEDVVNNLKTLISRYGEIFGGAGGDTVGGYVGELLQRSLSSVSRGLMQENSNIQYAVGAVNLMQKNMLELEEALTKLPTVDVTAKLDKLADSSGMIVKGKLPVVTGKEVVINLNLEVTMDAGKVEDVLIMRKESIIRDRINFLAGKSDTGIQSRVTAGATKNQSVNWTSMINDNVSGVIRTNQKNPKISGEGVS